MSDMTNTPNKPSVQPPTREQIDTAVGAVLFNASNYPRSAMPHMLGQDIGPLRAKVTDAVLALFPQPGPRAESTAQVPVSLIVRILKEEAHPYTCDSHNMRGIPARWGDCDCWQAQLRAVLPQSTPSAEPVSIADMAPGIVERWKRAQQAWRIFQGAERDMLNGRPADDALDEQSGARATLDALFDVTPPPATPEEGDR
jgi:hypothetical protein